MLFYSKKAHAAYCSCGILDASTGCFRENALGLPVVGGCSLGGQREQGSSEHKGKVVRLSLPEADDTLRAFGVISKLVLGENTTWGLNTKSIKVH